MPTELTPIVMSNGVALVYAFPDATGNDWVNDGNSMLWVAIDPGYGPKTVRLASQRPSNYGDTPDHVVTCQDGVTMIGPFSRHRFNDSGGKALVTYDDDVSAGVGVAVLSVQVSASPLLEEIAAVIEGGDLDIHRHPTVGYPLFLGSMQDKPHTAVGLLESGGKPPQQTFDDVLAIRQPRIVVLARSQKYHEARALANALFELLSGQRNMPYILALMPLQSPFLIERDEEERYVIGFNLQVQVPSI